MSFNPDSYLAEPPAPAAPAGFDPDQYLTAAPESVEPSWDVLFADVDKTTERLSIAQRQQFEAIKTHAENTDELKAQALNQSYISWKLPGFDQAGIQSNWPAVKAAYARTVLGIGEEDIPDTAFYAAIRDHEQKKKAHLREEFAKAGVFDRIKMLGESYNAHLGKNAGDVWDMSNKPFVPIKRAPQMEDMRSLGMANPALVAGVYNTLIPVIEGIETPMGVGTLGIGAGLKTASGVIPLAKQALVGMGGFFTGLMAKGTVESAMEAPAVLNDPNSTLQERIEAVGAPVTSAALTVLAGLGTAMEFQGPAKAKVMTEKLQGRTVGEAARVIREEAAKATDPKEAAALVSAAERLEALSPEAIKAQEAAATAAKQAKEAESTATPAQPAKIEQDPVKAKESADQAIVGIKNAAIDQELADMGLPAATHGEKLEFEAARIDAAAKMEANPLAGQKLIQQLQENPRPVTGKENALLLHELNRLSLERSAADSAYLDAVKGGDPVAIDAARIRVTQAIDDYRKAADVDTLVGTENAQGLAFRNMMMREDYSLASMERQMSVANEGRKLTEAQTEAVRTLHTKILDAEAKLAARLKAFKTRAAKTTVELEQKLATGDTTTKAKPEPLHLDMEANRLKAEADMLKLEFRQALERQKYLNSPPLSKAWQNTVNAYDTARLLMTTGEFSFIMRQGKMAALSHPVLTAKAIPDTFKAFVQDPAGAHAINLKILSHPDAPRAKAAKLHLVDEGASLSKQEEMLAAKWGSKIPVISRFNQATTTFLNKVRFDMFQQMRKSSGGLNALEEKQLAHFVNAATGRGSMGALEAAAVPLGRLMFSPRFLASRIQIAVGEPLWGGTYRTRRLIAAEYAKTLVGLSLYYSALKLAFGDKAEIGEDPRSSDFGKVKIGDTRLDPLAGIGQVVVFGARSASGEKATLKGNVHPIRGDDIPFGGDRWSDVAANFARSKLHPVPGSIINLFDGTDLAGNPADLQNQSMNLMAPLTWMDIYEALEEQDLPDGVALGLLALLGEGLSTYDQDTNKKTSSIYEGK